MGVFLINHDKPTILGIPVLSQQSTNEVPGSDFSTAKASPGLEDQLQPQQVPMAETSSRPQRGFNRGWIHVDVGKWWKNISMLDAFNHVKTTLWDSSNWLNLYFWSQTQHLRSLMVRTPETRFFMVKWPSFMVTSPFFIVQPLFSMVKSHFSCHFPWLNPPCFHLAPKSPMAKRRWPPRRFRHKRRSSAWYLHKIYVYTHWPYSTYL